MQAAASLGAVRPGVPPPVADTCLPPGGAARRGLQVSVASRNRQLIASIKSIRSWADMTERDPHQPRNTGGVHRPQIHTLEVDNACRMMRTSRQAHASGDPCCGAALSRDASCSRSCAAMMSASASAPDVTPLRPLALSSSASLASGASCRPDRPSLAALLMTSCSAIIGDHDQSRLWLDSYDCWYVTPCSGVSHCMSSLSARKRPLSTFAKRKEGRRRST